MKTKHTPGPYRIENFDGQRDIVADDGHGAIATVLMRRSKTNNVDEMDANAALFAATPDLLAALKLLEHVAQSVANGNGHNPAHLHQPCLEARAVIAKAQS